MPTKKDGFISKIKTKEKHKKGRRWSGRAPFLLVAIFAMLVYVGIEITEGLGWLSAEQWLDDFLSLVGVFGFVIFVAILVGVLFVVFMRYRRNKKNVTNWADFGGGNSLDSENNDGDVS